MPFVPFKFIHAANAFLDEPLTTPETLSSSSRAIVEEATLQAFANLVSTCETTDIDFLLLTGNVFAEPTRSLQARVVLQDGLNRLNSANIPVYILPGEYDPPSAWKRIPCLPPNVVLLEYEQHSEPLAVMRHGRVIASLAPLLLPERGCEKSSKKHPADEDESDGPNGNGLSATVPAPCPAGVFRIGYCLLNQEGHLIFPSSETPSSPPDEWEEVVSARSSAHAAELISALEDSEAEYLALCGLIGRTFLRTDSGVIHHPGPLQPRSSEEGETGGATLVEVNSRNDIRCSFLPTAPVLFARLKLNLPDSTSLESVPDILADHALQELKGGASSPPVRLRLCEWVLTTSADWAAEPLSPEEQAHLLSRLPGIPARQGDAGDSLSREHVAQEHALQIEYAGASKVFSEHRALDSAESAEEETASFPPHAASSQANEPSAGRTQYESRPHEQELSREFCNVLKSLEISPPQLLRNWDLCETPGGQALLQSARRTAEQLTTAQWKERIASRGLSRLQETAEGEPS